MKFCWICPPSVRPAMLSSCCNDVTWSLLPSCRRLKERGSRMKIYTQDFLRKKTLFSNVGTRWDSMPWMPPALALVWWCTSHFMFHCWQTSFFSLFWVGNGGWSFFHQGIKMVVFCWKFAHFQYFWALLLQTMEVLISLEKDTILGN